MKTKEEILGKKREKSIAMLLKNDVRKKLRDIMDENENEEAVRIKIKEQWFMLFTLANMAKGLSQKLKVLREKEQVKQKKSRLSFFLANKIHNFHKFRGENVRDRTVLDIRM